MSHSEYENSLHLYRSDVLIRLPTQESLPDCFKDSRNYVTRQRRSKYEIILKELPTVLHSVKDKDIMIANFACCTPEHTVRQAAEMMVRHDCGEIAIVESVENLKPIGVITDRDIAWRVVAAGKSPTQTSVRDAMLSDL